MPRMKLPVGAVALILASLVAQPLLGAQERAQLVASSARTTPDALSAQQQNILSLPARLDGKDVTLEAALKAHNVSSGVAAAYRPTLIQTENLVPCPCMAATVEQAMRTLLEETAFEFVALADQLIVRQRRTTPPRGR